MKEVKWFFEIRERPTLCSVIFVKRDLDSLLYSIALARSIKTRKGYNLWNDDNLQPGGMENAADKVVKLVKLVYNPFAFELWNVSEHFVNVYKDSFT